MEFNEVYSTHKQFVYNVVRKLARYNLELTEDICQEVWIRIFRKLHQYEQSKGVIEGWLYRIASNEVFHFYNLQKENKELYCLDTDYSEKFYYDVCDFSDAFKEEKQDEVKEKIELIKEKASNLKAGQREVFMLYHFEGFNHDEIANIKGVSSNTSKSQLTHARRKIKELIA